MPSYRLLTYESESGPRAGIAVDARIYDAAKVTGQPAYVTTLDVLNDWRTAQRLLTEAAQRIASQGRPLDRTQLHAPVLYPSAIYCMGGNYFDHLEEMAKGAKIGSAPDPQRRGSNPWAFIKATRSVTGPDTTIALPKYSQKVDWEIELAAVIGTRAKEVAVENALGCIAGYTIANDLSARDFVARSEVAETSPFRYDWLSQKSFDGACPLGPWITPASDIRDPQNLKMKLWVNDVLKQDSHTGKMIFSVAEQVAYLSSRMTLHPGDIVLTGTPAGVGMARGEFLKSGDVIKMWIEGMGTMTNRFC